MTNASFISTRFSKRPLEMTRSLPLELVTSVSAPEIVAKSQLSHSEIDLDGDLQWDNDVKHHIARNVFHLRRFRDLSQAEVAARMKTSQSAVARIEAAEENLTANTLRRLITALRGRFFVSIAPEEWAVDRRPWWKPNPELASDTSSGWTAAFVVVDRTGTRALLGLQHDGTLPPTGFSMFKLGTSEKAGSNG